MTKVFRKDILINQQTRLKLNRTYYKKRLAEMEAENPNTYANDDDYKKCLIRLSEVTSELKEITSALNQVKTQLFATA
jgi:hypothetical protein